VKRNTVGGVSIATAASLLTTKVGGALDDGSFQQLARAMGSDLEVVL
jgi:hypothetical protein